MGVMTVTCAAPGSSAGLLSGHERIYLRLRALPSVAESSSCSLLHPDRVHPTREALVDLNEVLNRLYTVARAHRAWGDRLSQELHRIADSILELELYQSDPTENRDEINRARIREIKRLIWELTNNILIFPKKII